ncbi:hypothetical protein L218DRAFT_874451 [Marasmius fiardii PR-910]|nr:hypothetical protein L218DRAFT_874451 [Marasmius fiardii PR-910]
MLVDFLHCPLCKNLLQVPITLPCGHSICSIHRECSLHDISVSASHVQPDVTLAKVLHLHHKYLDNPDDNEDESDDDSNDLLSHLRSQAKRERRIAADEPVIPLQVDTEDAFQKELVSELSCEICFSIFYEPTTTPCGHTFCSRCLHRSLDHSSWCPLCRQQLPGFNYFQNHPPNNTVLSILLDQCPTAYRERGEAIEAEERNARLDTPIFVCQLSFPGMPTLLHFFQPQYRLMLRRCLASPRPSFGMIMSSSNTQGQVEYGTMLEIRSVQMLPDGRSMVETWGVWRFRILERGILDGYVVGRVERIDDVEDDLSEEEEYLSEMPAIPPSSSQNVPSHSTQSINLSSPSNSPWQSPQPISLPHHSDPPPLLPLSTTALIAYCNSFLAQLHTNTTPWVVQRLSYTHGPPPPPPDDPSFDAGNFSFYVGTVLPIDEWEKAKLLPVRSVRMRLKMCVWWIEGLKKNWWFERGCVVL